MRNAIYVYMREPCIAPGVLAPQRCGTRYVLWVQGCRKSCRGCIAASSHRMEDGTPISIGALAAEIACSKAEGLTISGGEPFLQAEELAAMIRRIRQFPGREEMNVIVYSGYTYEELRQKKETAELLQEADLLIDGPYIQELNDGGSLRGSSNQRVIALSSRLPEAIADYGNPGRQSERIDHGMENHVIGIPAESGKEGIENERI